jgi:hypothetical protein
MKAVVELLNALKAAGVVEDDAAKLLSACPLGSLRTPGRLAALPGEAEWDGEAAPGRRTAPRGGGDETEAGA